MFKRISSAVVAVLLLCTASAQAADYKLTFTASDFYGGSDATFMTPPAPVVTGSFVFSAADASLGDWQSVREIDVVVGSHRYGVAESQAGYAFGGVVISGNAGGYGWPSTVEDDFLLAADLERIIFAYSDISTSQIIWTTTSVQMSITEVTAVPEPETYAMLLAGLGLMGFVARRRKA